MREIAPFGLRMPLLLRKRLEEVCAQSGRSLNSEVLQRLESSFVKPPPSCAQHELALPLPAEIEGNRVGAAHDVFEAVFAVAERMRVDRATAIARALQSALKRTGVDFSQELGLPTAASKPAPRAAQELGDAQQLRAFLQGRDSVLAEQICREALGSDPANRGARMRVSVAMRSMGWTGTRRRVGGARKRVYLRPQQER